MESLPHFKSRKILIRGLSRLGFRRPRPESHRRAEIKKNLAAVYLDHNGQIPDMSRLEKEQRPLWRVLLYWAIGVAFLLLALSVAGFFVFSRLNQNGFTNENIVFGIETPIAIVSGKEMEYKISLVNREEVNLYNGELELFYPENFEFIAAEPVPLGDNKNLWRFNVLKIGETQEIKIRAKTIAAVGSVLTIKGTFSFKPSGFNAVYKQEAIVDAAVSASVISLDVSGPEKTLANQNAEYLIKYSNVGEENLSNLQIFAVYPDGFVFNSAAPEPLSDHNDTWNVAALKPGESQEIKVSGNYLAASDGGNYDFQAQVRLYHDGDYYPQGEASFVTAVVKDQLSLKLIVNGSAEDQPVNFSDLLVYTLTYKNTGQDDLRDVKLSAHLVSSILDWDTLQEKNRGVVKGDTISWSGQSIPKLLKLGPGEGGEISWTVKIKSVDTAADDRVTQFSVENYIDGSAKRGGAAGETMTFKSQTVLNSINSDLGLKAAARYYNEDDMPLGLGPIEPKVGEESNYNIKVELANNLHDVEDLVVIATLPQNATWADKENHTAGSVIYNAKAKKLTWTISRLPKTARYAEMTFNVAINPKEDDLGRVLILVSDVSLTAKDQETGADIKKNVKAITTSFSDPVLGQTEGIVQ